MCGKLVINFCAVFNRSQSSTGELFFNDGWRACGQCARRNDYSLSDYAAGRHHRLLADYRGMQQYGAHSDHRAFLHNATFQQGAVTDSHIIFEYRWYFGRRMDYRVVLNVRSAADDDPAFVTAQHNAVPDAGAIADL